MVDIIIQKLLHGNFYIIYLCIGGNAAEVQEFEIFLLPYFMTNNNSDFLAHNYIDIIHIKNGYSQIDFKEFLSRHFNRAFPFIENSEIHEKLKLKLKEEYGDIKKTYFIKYGVLEIISISDLKFYQPYIGIAGPCYHQLTDPVFVIKNGDDYILWEGYHRILQKILNNETTINCYLMSF